MVWRQAWGGQRIRGPTTSVVGSAFATPVPAEEIHDACTNLSVPQQTSSPFTIRILHRTRTILTTLGTLCAPSIAARSMQSVLSWLPRIESNLSLPICHTLSVRMGSPHLPHPPAVPRSITQVDLAPRATSPPAATQNRPRGIGDTKMIPVSACLA